MNSYVEKKENINGTKEITYKVKKIAPISLIKSTNQTLMRKKLTTLKSTYLNESKKILNNCKKSRIISKRSSKNKTKLNNTLNPHSILNKLIILKKKSTSSSTNREKIFKKKTALNILGISHKNSNTNSLNKNKEKKIIENKIKITSNNNEYKENKKKFSQIISKQNSYNSNKNFSIKSRENLMNDRTNNISNKSRENSINHMTSFSFIKNNALLKINVYSNNNSYKTQRANSFQNSLRNTIIRKETSVSKKISINILRERQNNLEKKKMYKSFLNQKKNSNKKTKNTTLNVNLNKKFIEIGKRINEKSKKLSNNNSINKIQVHRDKENIEDLKKTNFMSYSLNDLLKERKQYLRTYSSSLPKEKNQNDSIDNIDNILSMNIENESEKKKENNNEEDEYLDIDSVIKIIHFENIRVNAKSIFSYKFNREYEFYTSKFIKDFEQNILLYSNSNNALNTTSSTLTRRSKENSSSLSLIYNNQL
jgi:hypothetical protein